MKREFTASNGYVVRYDPTAGLGRLTVHFPSGHNVLDGHDYCTNDELAALREFFQHERDEELGRWRWPENPDIIVVLKQAKSIPRRVVMVMQESTCIVVWRDEAQESGSGRAELDAAARAYFAAHPEPKPWTNPKPGELWELTVGGITDEYVAVKCREGVNGIRTMFLPTKNLGAIKLGPEATLITDGRRIYPEADQ